MVWPPESCQTANGPVADIRSMRLEVTAFGPIAARQLLSRNQRMRTFTCGPSNWASCRLTSLSGPDANTNGVINGMINSVQLAYVSAIVTTKLLRISARIVRGLRCTLGW